MTVKLNKRKYSILHEKKRTNERWNGWKINKRVLKCYIFDRCFLSGGESWNILSQLIKYLKIMEYGSIDECRVYDIQCI